MEIPLRGDIPDLEERSLKVLQRLLKRPWKYPEVFGIPTQDVIRALKMAKTIDDVHETSPTVAQSIIEMAEAIVDAKRADNSRKYVVRGENRGTYLPTALLVHKETEDKAGRTITRFQGDIRLECAGLVPRMVHYAQGDTMEPVAVSMVNMLPPDDDLGLKHRPIGVEHLDNMNHLGLMVSGERVAWQKNSPGFAWVKKAFPKAIDMRAYNHSLKAPLIPGGYLPEVEVVFKNLTTEKVVGFSPELVLKGLRTLTVQDIWEALVRGVPKGNKEAPGYRGAFWPCAHDIHHEIQNGEFCDVMEMLGNYDLTYLMKPFGRLFIEVPAEDDGSGRIHPDHPAMEMLHGSLGYCPKQGRILNAAGVFAKGAWAVDERAVDEDGNPAIVVSWNQVKGRWKGLAKKRSKSGTVFKTKVHMGFLQAWDRKRFIAGCFELLENVGLVVDETWDAETTDMVYNSICGLVHSLVDEYMNDLGKDGPNGLLAAISKDDPGINLITKLIAKANAMEIAFDPMKVTRLREAMDQKLQRRLWTVAQGAAIRGQQQVIFIDAGLRRGQMVTSAVPVGAETAVYRFPAVLEQSLKCLRNQPPNPGHLVKGKVPLNVIWMNPDDVLDMQGDDDGDIVGITTDGRVLELFEWKLNNDRYQIEPKGEKLEHTVDSKKGVEYVRGTPMGPVGIMTIYRSKLLAVGDVNGARAMSVMVQEAIDKAKRAVVWTDWTKAARPQDWKLIDGVYHLHYEGSKNYLRDRCGDWVRTQVPGKGGRSFEIKEPTDGEMPIKAIAAWVSNRLESFGCVQRPKNKDEKRQNPLGWRVQHGEAVRDGKVVMVDLRKRIHPTLWTDAESKQGGFKGGNLVHISHDRALQGWMAIAGKFESVAEGDIRTLLNTMLAHQGHKVEVPNMTWPQYQIVRSESGLKEFGDKMRNAMAMDSTNDDGTDNSAKYAEIDAAYTGLYQRLETFVQKHGIQGLVNIWWMETTDTYRVEINQRTYYTSDLENVPDEAYVKQVNNPNHAINSVAWPGSPVLRLLDITSEQECDYLTRDRISKIVNVGLTKPNSFEWLAKKIWINEEDAPEGVMTHTRAHGIPLHQCPHCKDRLQTAMVRGIRAASKRKEKAFLGRIIYALNSAGKYSAKGGAKEMGIELKKIMAMSEDELRLHVEALEEAKTKQERAKRNLMLKRLRQVAV